MQIRGDHSAATIESFLSSQTIPVRLGCETPTGHPWLVSLWYLYRDDRLWCATEADAAVVSYLEYDPEVAFEVSTNDPPYAGVRGRGTATIEPDPEKTLLRDLLERYLGGTDSDLGRRLLVDDRDEVTIAIEPAVVYGWDYADRMPASSDN